LKTDSSESTACTAARTPASATSRSTDVLTINVTMGKYACESGRYMNAFGASPIVAYLLSRATPTTSIDGPRLVPPFQMRTPLPIGFSRGQNRRAIVWLTIATSGRPVRSASAKSRPATSGMPSVRKCPRVTALA
jgi:hypothetical protein